MLRYILGAWAVIGALIAGLLTAVAQNPPPLANSRPAQPEPTATRDLEIQFRTTGSGKLEIATLDRRSAAYASGLREGDRIVSVAGRTIEMEQVLRQIVRETPQDPIPVVVTRHGRQERILLTRTERARREEPPIGAHSRATIGVRLIDSPSGVRIAEVAPGSPAARAGLRLGDFIVRLEGQQYQDATALASAVARSPVASPLALDVMQGGTTRRVEVRPESYAAVYGRQPGRGDRPLARRPSSPAPEQQRFAARPDFDLTRRVEQLETELASLRRELQAVRDELETLRAAQPDRAAAEPGGRAVSSQRALSAPEVDIESTPEIDVQEVPEPPGRTDARDSRRAAEPDDVLPSPPQTPQE